MSQSGYTPILIYASGTATNVPLAANLTSSASGAELALNYADGKLYYKDSGGVVQVLASKAGSVNVSSFSAGTTGFTPSTATTGVVTLAGTLITSNGGTGLSSYTAGDLSYYASGTALTKLAIGTNGYVLQSNGTAPTWVAASTVVGGAAGSNTQIQFNNAGALGASSNLTWSGTVLATTGLTATGAILHNTTTNNQSYTTTGAGTITISSGTTGTIDGMNIGATTAGTGRFSSITNTGLTSGRVVYSTTGGLETDSANLTFNGTTLTANTIGAFTLSGTVAGGGNQLNNVIIGTSTPLAGAFTTLSASTSVTNSSLTSGRVVYSTTGGLETDSAGLTFDGTNFATTGTATAAKLIPTGTSVTGNGMYLPATNSVGISTAGTNAVYIDASQNVGLGVSSLSYKLELQGSVNTYFGQRIYNTNAGSSAVSYLQIGNDSNGATAQLGLNSSTNTTNYGGANGLYLSNGLSAAIAFATAGGERMRIDSSGNVGIGATSPSSAASKTFTVQNGGSSGSTSITTGDYASAGYMIPLVESFGARNDGNSTFGGRIGAAFRRTDGTAIASGANLGYYAFGGQWGTDTSYQSAKLLYAASIIGVAEGSFTSATAMPTAITFCTGSTGGAISAANTAYGTERMRIDSSGNLLVGTTTVAPPPQGFTVSMSAGGSYINVGHINGTSSGTSFATFSYNSTFIGSISQSGTTAVLYNLTSDQRLKENIQDAESASALIDAIQVRQFDWKSDASHQRYGFVAQELVTVAPEAVHQPVNEEEMMGVDYSKLVPMLVKEIQSLRKRLADAGIA